MKLVIQMLTYNHEKFIRQAIQSVMDQTVNFHFCLFLVDDFSTDNTRKICIEMKEKYPEKIKLFLNETNFGIEKNAHQIHKICFESDAEYIAILEGDDYWTDVFKLQKQVDFLDANPDFAICFHAAKILYDEGVASNYPNINKYTKEVTTIEDMVKGNYIHTPTVVFRNNKLNLPTWFETAFPGDWVLHTINSTYGKIKFINEEMSVYRVHAGGANSTKSHNYRVSKYLPTVKNLSNYLKKSFPVCSKHLKKKYQLEYFHLYILENELNKSRLERSLLFIKFGCILKYKKILAFFWTPLVFGNKCKLFWDKY